MGFVVKLLDAYLFLTLLVVALAAPLIDAQTCLPLNYFPEFLIELRDWYIDEYDHYLMADKPDFFVGLVWLELLFQWPLVLFNLYGILAAKPWFQTTCLIFGVSFSTSLVAILSEMMGSKRAPDKLLMTYLPFMGLALLATLRGLLPHSTTSSSFSGKRTALARKKRA